MSTFFDLGVAEPIRRALTASSYQEPTPIQSRAIPLLLEGRDLLGIAQTGTGKTAAFALPILQRLAEQAPRRGRGPAALVLTPTRELAVQVAAAFKTYGRYLNLRGAVLYGGVGQVPQVRALRSGLDYLVATPGRLLDLMEQGHAQLGQVSLLVLDEADRMLDMGFIRDIRRILAALPRKRQSMLLSATMPAEIARLANSMLDNPARVEVAPTGTAVERVDQRVFHIATARKRALLSELLRDPDMRRVIVFTRTKHGANRVAAQLAETGVSAAAIHGNKSQAARQNALDDFRSGRSRVLVATDIAARGIDVEGVTHIVNYELPNVPETYVHRIGRTARAGAAGSALSFCDTAERPYLRDIETLVRRSIEVIEAPRTVGSGPRAAHPIAPKAETKAPVRPAQPKRRRRPRSGGRPASQAAA
ncbi:MAG: DEAD/DEAH box helicase [Rhodospirillales bacterium]|nr:DEAD/DEAH box helicase [Rhodospirillales bacterium]